MVIERARVKYAEWGLYILEYQKLQIEAEVLDEEQAKDFCDRNGVEFQYGAVTTLEERECGEVPGADAGVHEGVSGSEGTGKRRERR